MKPTIVIGLSSAFLGAALWMAAAPAEPPKADASQNSLHISTFVDRRGFGKDPFFPRSKRLEPTLTINTNAISTSGELPVGLVLKGLSGTPQKPLAIINNYTFAAGEEAEVRVGHQLYRIKVVEIKDRSVVVSVNGSPARELTLRQGL